jgi:hypothetical protein
MRSIVGLFVQLPGLTDDQLSKMFDRIVKDRRKDSPYYVETLVLDPIARFDRLDPNSFRVSLYEDKLDRIKDYLPHFDYLFVGSFPAEEINPPSTIPANIEDSSLRGVHIRATRIVAQLFIDYLRRNNITIPIHWYINWEANLNRFTKSGYKNAWKAYLLPFTNALTQISQRNGLNEPEFFWSPYFRRRYGSLLPPEKNILISLIRDVLQSAPRLGWLHFQDGVGRDARKNPDGTITYRTTAEDVINYYHHILVRASGGNLRSGLINMEFYVDENKTLHGDPLEHEERQCKYMRANIPVGISFEIRYWYESVINQMELYSLKNIFIDKGIPFPVSISEVAHDLGLGRPISIKDLACRMK